MKRRKKDKRRGPLKRILVIWAVQTAAIITMAVLFDAIYIENVQVAVMAAAVLGLLNALLWPLLSFVLVPFAVFTLGLAALLMNGLIVYLASDLVRGFSVEGYWTAFWMAIGLAIINIILSSLLTIDDDHSWSRNVLRRQMKRKSKVKPSKIPGIIFLEIDGLSRPVLERAMKLGYTPNMWRWLKKEGYKLTEWTTDLSAQTSASQAGILHGDNTNMPAFRWYDKQLGTVASSNDAKFLPILEKQRSNGKGLLSNDGSSRGNMLSGDAKYVTATASTIMDKSKFHASEFQSFFSNPYNMTRTLVLFVWDIIQEKRQYRKARKNGVTPILPKSVRGGIYPLARAGMVVVMRELNIDGVIGDMFSGRTSTYTTFVGYDEVAHHSGILDEGAFEVLSDIDQQFGRVESAVKVAPRPYRLVVLSDHGQTPGATFKQRYNESLKKVVVQLVEEHIVIESGGDSSGEGMSGLSAYMTDAVQADGVSSKVIGKALESKTVNGQVILDKDEWTKSQLKGKKIKADGVVLASGNLGLISFTKWKKRMTLDQLEKAFPALIPGLVKHEGVGFVMVKTKDKGTVVLGKGGKYFLKNDKVEGKNPLRVFGKGAADRLRRTDGFRNCPDILVNSFYDPKTGEACAFEELIGFHGGLGGMQTQPFILHPKDLKVEGNIVGAAGVYKHGKKWLSQLGN